MPDPTARKRLKKKMIDRWENEGGAIAADATNSDNTSPTNEDKGRGKRLSSQRDNSTVCAPESSTKKPKPTRK